MTPDGGVLPAGQEVAERELARAEYGRIRADNAERCADKLEALLKRYRRQ